MENGGGSAADSVWTNACRYEFAIRHLFLYQMYIVPLKDASCVTMGSSSYLWAGRYVSSAPHILSLGYPRP